MPGGQGPERQADASLILVGKVTAPVGLDGSLRVEPYSDVPNRFAPGETLLLRGAPHRVQRLIRGRLLVLKLEGVDSRAAAEKLRGAELYVRQEAVPEPPADTYYHYQLLGMEVIDPQGKVLGVLAEILSYPAHDVYVVRGERGETLVPAVAEVVKAVDVEARRMVVDLPPMV